MGKKKSDWYFSYEQRQCDKRRHLWQKRNRAMENADYEEAMSIQEKLDYRHADGSDVYPGDSLMEAIWTGKLV